MTVVLRKSGTPRGRSIRDGVLGTLVRSAQQHSTPLLAGVALSSILVYWFLFTRPFSLVTLHERSLLDLYDLAQEDGLARWRLLGGYLSQGLLYWVGWRLARRCRGRAAWVVVLVGTLLSSLILLFQYPLGAADVFDNIMHGRILGVYGANPFQKIPSDFQGDPFYRYVAWRYSPSAYGPAWELLAGATAHLAGDAVVTNVLAFKLLAGLFLLGGVGVVTAVLRQAAPERALAGVVLLAWNPVMLVETFGQGHNDVAMVFWILVAAWALLRDRYTLAVLALVTGALFKFIPLLLLPAAILIALKRLPGTRARVSYVVVTLVASAAVVVLAYAPFWRGLETLDIERRQRLFTTSLSAVAYVLAEPQLGQEGAAALVSRFAAGITALFALWQGLQTRRDSSWLAFPKAVFNTLMFYLLLGCPWFQSWYALWPLGIAALLPPGHAARLGALFGYAVLSKPLIFGPLWLWIRPLPSRMWRELRLGPAVLALPWFYALAVMWRRRWRRRARYRNQGLHAQ